MIDFQQAMDTVLVLNRVKPNKHSTIKLYRQVHIIFAKSGAGKTKLKAGDK